MSSLKSRMNALTGGSAIDVTKALARSPADSGGGPGGSESVLDARSKIERKVGLG